MSGRGNCSRKSKKLCICHSWLGTSHHPTFAGTQTYFCDINWHYLISVSAELLAAKCMSYYKMAFETTKHDLEITKPQRDPLLSVSSVKKRHSRGQEKFE